MNQKLFREKALERLSSPDNLHELVDIASAKSWLAVLAIAGLTLAFLSWATFGKIPKAVDGEGILIQSGGIAEATALATGVVQEMKVTEGQFVKRDEIIAVIDQPELELQIKNATEKLKELQQNKAEQLDINDLKRTIEELEIKYEIAAYIRSPYEGKIIELMSNIGKLVEVGTPVVSIEISSQESVELEAIIYVSPDEGKKVTAGMQVRIAPSTVRIEEYGYIKGEVFKVSEYPSTKNGMTSVLGNAALVETFFKAEPPIAIRVKLSKAKNKTGYAWTSAQGPPIKINAGTLCKANIVVSEQRPLSLLVPHFQ